MPPYLVTEITSSGDKRVFNSPVTLHGIEKRYGHYVRAVVMAYLKPGMSFTIKDECSQYCLEISAMAYPEPATEEDKNNAI